MTTAEELLDEDGGVRVPARTAAGLFGILWRHCQTEQREHGAVLSPEMHALLIALHRAASGATGAPASSRGSPVAESEILGAHEVAEILGCSRRWATALLSSGRLGSRRVGRDWVTTRGDLDRYRFEEPAHAHEEDHLGEQAEQR